MKKIMAAALIGTMVLSLAACGKQPELESSGNIIDRAAEPITSSETSKASEEAPTASGETVVAPDFSGSFTEPLSGRCLIDIESLGDNNYKINVRWSSSAFETANWEMNATYYDSTTLLEYTGAKYYVRTYSSEEEYQDDVVYTDGAGEFWFEGDGKLGWRSANSDVDGITGDTVFEKIEYVGQ